MTESNFATSSVAAAVNIVLSASTIWLWSEVRRFCWALAVETFAEKISEKATVANVMRSRDDMNMKPAITRSVPVRAFRNRFRGSVFQYVNATVPEQERRDAMDNNNRLETGGGRAHGSGESAALS